MPEVRRIRLASPFEWSHLTESSFHGRLTISCASQSAAQPMCCEATTRTSKPAALSASASLTTRGLQQIVALVMMQTRPWSGFVDGLVVGGGKRELSELFRGFNVISSEATR